MTYETHDSGKRAATFNEAVKARAAQVAELVIRKQRDYGPNNIMRNHVRPELALAVRLSDKIARVVNLAEKGTDPSNEALQDTWMDIVGYGLIGLMVLSGEFELPLEEGRARDEEAEAFRAILRREQMAAAGMEPCPPDYIIKFPDKMSPEFARAFARGLAQLKRMGLFR